MEFWSFGVLEFWSFGSAKTLIGGKERIFDLRILGVIKNRGFILYVIFFYYLCAILGGSQMPIST